MDSLPSLSRRTVLGAIAGVAAPMLVLPGRARAETATLAIANGRLQGIQENGAVSFKGIPYAADTGGRNRFMAPRPVGSWTGVRDASRFGDRAPQAGRGGQARREPTAPESENCCVLNVYAPDLNPNARRPVMFWMHGGGFRGGNGDSPELHGQNLARLGDVVVVVINHRLNVLGYTYLGHLDPDFADAGNAGQLDLIAALEWVKTNISAFGGDPGNVTIFGQSGGGSKVSTLMVMPGAEGLFHRAINLSGPTFIKITSSEDWEPLSNAFVRKLGLGRGDLRRLQELPVAQLQDAHAAAVRELQTDDFRPVVDGRHIPYAPFRAEAMAMKPHIPLMIGTTDTEATIFMRSDPTLPTITEDQVAARIQAQYGWDDDRARALMAAYRRNPQNRTPWEVLRGLASDSVFRGPMLKAAETLAAARAAPVYVYNFNWTSPDQGGVWGAPHTADIPFIFGTLASRTLGVEPGSEEASRRTMAAYVAFARTGDPNNSEIPAWAPYDGVRRATMTLNTECRLVEDYRGADRIAQLAAPSQESFELLAGPMFLGDRGTIPKSVA